MELLTIPQKTAADLLGVTPRRLRQIEAEQPDNPPPRDEQGQYPARQYGEWLRQQWRASVGFADDGRVFDYDAERARLTHHQANAAAQEDQRKRGELIPADQVAQYWGDIVSNARSRLLSLPSRIAGVCARKDQSTIEAEARAIIHEVMAELAAAGNDGRPPA